MDLASALMDLAPHVAKTALLVAAALTAAASLAHFACIPLGAPAFRFLGAGERFAGLAARGHWLPPLTAVVIGLFLGLCAAYALCGAGAIGPLPLRRWVLPCMAAVFLLRAGLFPWLRPVFPGNSSTFWWVTSTFCAVIGLAYVVGLLGTWPHLA